MAVEKSYGVQVSDTTNAALTTTAHHQKIIFILYFYNLAVNVNVIE
jgi:hypothetical protein